MAEGIDQLFDVILQKAFRVNTTIPMLINVNAYSVSTMLLEHANVCSSSTVTGQRF